MAVFSNRTFALLRFQGLYFIEQGVDFTAYNAWRIKGRNALDLAYVIIECLDFLYFKGRSNSL